MLQLKVYESLDKNEMFFLDLYDTEPIKLTLSIEDITNADATSVYSKTFKVPGTRKNAEFFKNVFDVDATLYDVTLKKPAEILVDGAEFKTGHIRLQKIFWNGDLDRYDYELLFLGETRDLSSVIADKSLCELPLPDLIGGASGPFTPDDAVLSWQAYPQSPSLTAGLHNGNIIYPLIDHGNSYDSAGDEEQTKIATTTAHANGSFIQNSHPLKYDRLKPMIRAKRLWDQIFDDAGYTYTSSFINSDLFHQIYISAFGNQATVGWDLEASSSNSDNIASGQQATSDIYNQVYTQAIVDPGSNVSTSVFNFPGSGLGTQPVTVYTVPAAGSYDFAASCVYNGYFETSDYQQTPVPARLLIYNKTTASIIVSGTLGSGLITVSATLDTTTTANFSVGDQIIFVVQPNSGTDGEQVINSRFDVLKAPGQFNPAANLDCTYKQIDFLKDILTAFRLVLSPDSNDPKNFIVEPWQTYINSGDLHDWSHKLVENKDVVTEPVFFSQSDEIKFRFQDDGDYINKYHKDAYQEPYGWLDFNSNNELLKGTRDVKLTGIAPTEIANIEGTDPVDLWNIAQLHTHSSEDTGLQHLPIKPKTRMLFYNGLVANPVTWYLENATPETQSTYPLVSPYSEWPIAGTSTLNLNWANDVQYWGTVSGYNDNGGTLYTEYWSRYIESLYNKYSRRVTAYFTLNNIDLNEFSFDDTIFVNGTYYRPEKINNVEIGNTTEVQVQLLTANDYRPQFVIDENLFEFTAVGVGGCPGGFASIDVTTNGTPGFQWQLSNGLNGTSLVGAPVGAAPYTFSIQNVLPGTYTLDVQDSLGRTATETVVVPSATGSAPTATSVISDASDCTAPCNGQIIVTPTGGSGAPYTIYWYDDPTNTSFTRSGLCPANYSYNVFDSNGCTSVSYLATVTCEAPTYYVYEAYENVTGCGGLTPTFRVVRSLAPVAINTVLELQQIGGQSTRGCWTVIQTSTQTPTHEIVQQYPTCDDCEGIAPPSSFYVLEDCDDQQNWTVPGTEPFNIGDVVQYTRNVNPSTVYCGTIAAINPEGLADATLYSANAYSCGDTLHCNIPA